MLPPPHRQKARIARCLAAVEFKSPSSSALALGVEEYILTLYIGTPGQKFFLLADTGSDLVWVQCRPCSSPTYRCYNETNPFFDPSASSSYSAVPCASSYCDPLLLGGGASCNSVRNCQISYAYGQPGSGYAGQLSTETISFSNSTEQGQLGISNVLFGCMNNDTASFGRVDGFVGLGRGPFSLPSQLSRVTSVNVFSYCLVPFAVSATLASSLQFGVSNPNGLQLVHTPLLNKYIFFTFYWVNMTGVSINGTAVRIPKASLEYNSSTGSGGTVFDSGTTNMVFSQDMWTAVVENLKDLIAYPSVYVSNTSLCYNISGVQQPEYPSMSLHFSGIDGTTVGFPLTGQNLFIQNSDDVECLAVDPAGGSIGPANIIGNVAQADHYVETDQVNMKIGWTSRDCSLPM